MSTWLVGVAFAAVGCADALRIEPTGVGQGGAATSGPGAGSGGGAVACQSSADCPEPTAVCDTVRATCVECLSIGDCAFKPGTVCNKGKCACAGGFEFCGPNHCVDLKSAQSDCGKCKHACFGACTNGSCNDPWEPVAAEGAPAARSNHVAVWTGKQMIVWGGQGPGSGNGATNTGGMYDPATFLWTATTTAAAPAPRYNATAVWSGKEMVVWGGIDAQGNYLSDGGRFDPVTNTWKSVSNAGAPGPRAQHVAAWSGTEMIVWGGYDGSNELLTGGRYNPSTDMWTSVQGTPQPNASRTRACALWDDKTKVMMVYGGFGDDSADSKNNVYWPTDPVTGGIYYTPTGDMWSTVTTITQPGPRADCTAVWDGTNKWMVFGGISDNSSGYLNTGASFDGGAWTPFSGTQPAARKNHTAVYVTNAKVMVVFGGQNSQPLDSGGVLDPNTMPPSWKAEPPRVLAARYSHTAVSTNDTMIVWGGQGNSGKLGDGGIYKP